MAWLLAGQAALAQSPALLEAVRTSQSDVVASARAEFEACARSRCPSLEALRLLTGLVLLSNNEAAQAVKVLSAGRAPPGLAPFRRWYLAEAQAWAGQRAQALRTLAGEVTGTPPWLKRRVEVRRAELQLELGQAARARPTLERAAAQEPTPELLLARARARLATGDASLGRDDLQVIALRFPRHPHARLALAELETQGPLHWTPEELLSRAQAFLSAGDPAGALESLAALPAPTQRGTLIRGQALLALGRDEPGLAALDAAAQGAGGALAAEAGLALGRRLMRLERSDEARAAFLRAETSWPREVPSEEAGYLSAWLALNQGHLEQAALEFEAWEGRHAGSRRRDEARWFRGFAWVRAGRFAQAREVLDGLVAEFPRSSLVPQALYWSVRARQLEAKADGGEALPGGTAEAYRALMAGFPGSLYARLALEQLRALGEEVQEPYGRLEGLPPTPTPPSLTLAAHLSACGLFRDAREEVDAVSATVTTAEQALQLGLALQTLGEFGAAYALAARHLWGAGYTARRPEALTLLYPRAWRATMERWAAPQAVEPAFAWAIMRRESSFRPEVSSFADARGLMQVIPSTARQIALDTHLEPPDPDDLYSPELNIRLGTWYLGRLFHRLGHPALVAAAYNGGPGPVVRWMAQRGAEPLDFWLEAIPYKETRAYVKQVLADAFLYQALYEPAVDRLALTLPPPRATGVSY